MHTDPSTEPSQDRFHDTLEHLEADLQAQGAVVRAALARATRGLVTGTRLGLNVRQVFAHVTYGHHWKEYSARELVQYFAMLSPDFDVRVRRLHFAGAPSPFAGHGPAGRLKDAVRRAGNASGVFAEQLEAVVTLRRRSEWRTSAPRYA